MTAESVKRGQQTKTKTKKDKIIEYKQQGLTEREISTLTNTPNTTVHNTLQTVKNDPDYQVFTTTKAEKLEELQWQIYKSVDLDSIKTMVNKRGLTDLAILQDKIQLLRGEATSIQAVDIRGLIGCVIKSQETGKVEGYEGIEPKEATPLNQDVIDVISD